MADAVYMVPVYEKDLKAVLRFLAERNPEEIENVAPKARDLAAPKVETQEEREAEKAEAEGATSKAKWSDQKLDEYTGNASQCSGQSLTVSRKRAKRAYPAAYTMRCSTQRKPPRRRRRVRAFHPTRQLRMAYKILERGDWWRRWRLGHDQEPYRRGTRGTSGTASMDPAAPRKSFVSGTSTG